MTDGRAFRGVRYSPKLESDIGLLLAPPYDVLSPHLIARLRDRHPDNMVHLEHIEPEPGTDPHAHAAILYRDWLQQGVLVRDTAPTLYQYDHRFTANGQELTRSGILAAVRLTDWSDRVVLPHEATFPAPRLERLRRLRAVQANLSPIYLLSHDPHGELQDLLLELSHRPPDVTGIDPDGEEHRLTLIADEHAQKRVHALLADRRLYVADGHHRYEAALAYRDERRATIGSFPNPRPEGPVAAEFVLALVCPANDPGVLVLPTHRLIHDLPEFDPVAIRRKLDQYFDVERLPVMASLEDDNVAALVADARTVCLTRFAGDDRLWRVRQRPGAPHEARMPNDRGTAWRELHLAMLSSVIVQGILRIAPNRLPAHVAYAHDVPTTLIELQRGEAQIAFFVRASTVHELMAVADAGETMPPKSTYFWPKVPAGLVIHDLTES